MDTDTKHATGASVAQAEASSVHEITIIDHMVSFFEENGASTVDQHVLRNMAEVLAKRMANTSPGTLQDVTMDNSYAIGYRSPCVSLNQYQGNASPGSQGGRSVREFEETLANLRKENFNLKLRLYFVEESIPGYHQALNNPDGPESIMKQLIDTKVETEVLRKELQEKQELLKDAAAAISLMDKKSQESEAQSNALIEELKQKVKFLEDAERNATNNELMDNILGRANLSDNMHALQKVRELEGLLKQSDERVFNLQNELSKFNELLSKRNETIQELEEKVKEQAFQNAEISEQLEMKEQECQNMERTLKELRRENSELVEKKRELTKAYECKKSDYQHEKFHINECQLKLRQQHDALTKLRTSKLQEELKTYKASLADKLCMLQEVEEKLQASDKKLQERLLKHEQACRTIHKLATVNKKLKDQLTKLSNCTTANTSDNGVVSDIEAHATNLAYDDQNEHKRLQAIIAQQKEQIEKLQMEINNYKSTNTQPEQKTAENSSFQRLLAQCATDEDLRDPTAHQIIEELRSELEQARLDAESAEKWRRECADVCTMLSNRLEELAGFLNSLLRHKDVLGVLAADRRRAIRKAVNRSLDLSKSLNMTLSFSGMSICEQSLAQLSNLSEILGDVENNGTFNSHEDQEQQALETLREENKALKRELDKRRHTDKKERRSLPLATVENQSESEAWSEPDRLVSLARMGLEEQNASNKEQNTSSLALPDTDSDSYVGTQNNRKQNVRYMEQRITQLEQLVAQRDARILEVQVLLVDADNRLKCENLRVLELEQQLRVFPAQIAEKTQALEQLQEERERIVVEARLAELQLGVLRTEIEDLKQRNTQMLQNAEEEGQAKLHQLKQQMEERLLQQKRLHAEQLKLYWVPKDVHEELQEQLSEQQTLLDSCQQKEAEYEENLRKAQSIEFDLKKQLDQNTIQASKLIMERNKVDMEKRELETYINELRASLQQHEEERNKLKQQIAQLEEAQKTREQFGYSSEEVANASTLPANNSAEEHKSQHRGHNNSSPDLGIESDAGRASSSGLENVQMAQAMAAIKKDILKEELSDGPTENMSPQKENADSGVVAVVGGATTHDCAKVEQENAELRRKLLRTKRAFEDTFEKLRLANQKKAQIEKDIRTQILKTHNVLKNVRHNMEN